MVDTMKRRLFFLVTFLSLSVGGISGLSQAHSAPAAFGFSNEPGNRILALEKIDQPNRITQAICGGTTFSVRFTAAQQAKENFDGRDTARQFGAHPGQVFAVNGSTVPSNSSCLLVSADFMRERRMLPVRSAGTGNVRDVPLACNARMKDVIAKAKKRRIKNCWRLALLSQAEVALVEFEMLGKDVLASMVLVDGEQLVFNDYPAEFNEVSTWRVDDGGKFDPNGFAILFALENSGKVEVGLEWTAFEGSNLFLLQSAGPKFKKLIHVYRYMSP